MIKLAEYVGRIWVDIESIPNITHDYPVLNDVNSYIDVCEWINKEFNINVKDASFVSLGDDKGVQLCIDLEDNKVNVGTIYNIDKDAVIGTDVYYSQEHSTEIHYTYILLNVEQDVLQL